MILTTLIALWIRKGSFKYSAVKKVFFCPASDACWDTSRVRALPRLDLMVFQWQRKLARPLIGQSLIAVSCPVKLGPSAVSLRETGLLLELGIRTQA